jgi:hypothetical protein
MPGVGPGYQWYHGVANGADIPNGLVGVRLEDGRQVKVPAAKVEKVKAILPSPERQRRQAVMRMRRLTPSWVSLARRATAPPCSAMCPAPAW